MAKACPSSPSLSFPLGGSQVTPVPRRALALPAHAPQAWLDLWSYWSCLPPRALTLILTAFSCPHLPTPGHFQDQEGDEGPFVVACAVGLGWFCPEVARSQDRVVSPTPSMGPSPTPAASVAWAPGVSDPPTSLSSLAPSFPVSFRMTPALCAWHTAGCPFHGFWAARSCLPLGRGVGLV